MSVDSTIAIPHPGLSAQQKRLAVGYGLVAAGAALFSTKAIFVKLAYMGVPDAPRLLAWRMLFSLPLFIAVGLYAWRRRGGRLAPGAERIAGLTAIVCGLIGYYLAALLDFEGLVHITAQLERLVLFTYPIFVMLLGRAFFGASLRMSGLAAACVTYFGLAIVFQQGFEAGGSDVLTGTLLVLGSAFAFALSQLMAKNVISKLGSLMFTSIAMTSASIGCIVHFVVTSGGFDFSAPPSFIMMAAAIAIFATVIPSFLVNGGLGRIGPQSTAMVSTFSPVVTIALSIVILGEAFTWRDAVGTALVIGGIALYTWLDVRRPKVEPIA